MGHDTGHDTHFLQRIERLSTPLADQALSLYRDSDMVRFILDRVRLPESAERVALALENRPGGPHIIVTRDGTFVTCLGAGMSVSPSPVVPRSQLDHLIATFETLRDGWERSGNRGETRRLLHALGQHGNALRREDFVALAAVYPLFATDMLRTTFDTDKALTEFRQRYTRGRYQRMGSEARAKLHLFWQSHWMMAHLAMLMGHNIHLIDDGLSGPVAPGQEHEMAMAVSWKTARLMSAPAVFRALWAGARAGRKLISQHKESLHRTRDPIVAYLNMAFLVTIGLRHSSTFAEVRKIVSSFAKRLDEPGWSEYTGAAAKLALNGALMVLEHPEATKRLHVFNSAAVLVKQTQQNLPAGHPKRFESENDVPPELAAAFPLLFDGNLYFRSGLATLSMLALPWIADASAEQFYLPASMLDYCPQWVPTETLELLDEYRQYMFPHARTARAEPEPGRNEPCTCGSGKKYKRCCGAK